MFAVANIALRRFLRDRSNLFFVFVLPFVIVFLVGYSSGSRASAPVAAVGTDTATGAAVLAHLQPDQFDEFADLAAAERAVGDTAASALVVFPDDPTEPIRFRSRVGTALDVRAELERAVAVENQRLVIDRQAALVDLAEDDIGTAANAAGETTVTVETIGQVIWGGLDNTDSAAMTQVILFMFLSALTASGFLVQDRRLGMAARKASAPVSVTRLVLGETLGRFWIAMFQGLLIVAITGLLFGVAWGNPLVTAPVLVVFGLVATGFGVLLGTALDNPESAGGIGVTIGIVFAALGGAMAPVEIFPDSMQTLARLTPHFWAIDALQSSLNGGTLTDNVKPLVVLTAFAGVVLAASTLFYRRRTFGER